MLTRNKNETLTVESRTVEEALAAISDKLGPDVEILGAQKVARGGVGGFFSREMVQISARPAPGRLEASFDNILEEENASEAAFHEVLRSRLEAEAEPAVEIDLGTTDDVEGVRVTLRGTGTGTGIDVEGDEAAVVAAMLAGPGPPALVTDPPVSSEVDTVPAPTQLAELPPAGTSDEPAPVQLAEIPATPTSETQPTPETPVEAEAPAPPVSIAVSAGARVATLPRDLTPSTWPAQHGGASGWSAEALLNLALPAEMIRACEALPPEADLQWVTALAATAAELCGDLPDSPTVFAGPGAHHLAGVLGLASVRAGDHLPDAESFCATVHQGDADRDWLVAAKGSRDLHLVVGEQGWAPLMIERPVAVSWTGDRALPGALYLAAALGVPLGFGGTGGFPVGVARADAVDVAVAIRRLVRV